MSDIEAPDADAAEQNRDALPEATDIDSDDELAELEELEEPPLEADEADSAEQARVAIDLDDDDEYR